MYTVSYYASLGVVRKCAHFLSHLIDALQGFKEKITKILWATKKQKKAITNVWIAV